jgi:acyl carrier protein
MVDHQQKRDPDIFDHEIKQIVSRISRIDAVDLQNHLLIREELGIDSLMAMEIIYACERHLGIRMDETLFTDVQTVGDFLSLLRSVSESEKG